MFPKKNIVFISLFLFLLFILISALILYYWTHPSSLQSLVEQRASKLMGVTVQMDSLSYSLHPLRLRVRGLKMGQLPAREKGQLAEVSDLIVDLERSGEFGSKTLVLHPVLRGVSITMIQGVDVTGLWTGSRNPSLIGRLLSEFVRVFLFEAVRLGSVSLKQGQARIEYSGIQARLGEVAAHLTPEKRLLLSCRADVAQPSTDMQLQDAKVEFSIPNGFVWSDPVFMGHLKTHSGSFTSPDFSAENLNLMSEIEFRPRTHTIRLLQMDLGLTVLESTRPELKRLLPAKMSLQSQGNFHLEQQQLQLEHFLLRTLGILEMQGSLEATFGSQTRVQLVLDHSRIESEMIRDILAPVFPGPLEGLQVSGPLQITGTLTARLQNSNWKYEPDLQIGPDALEFSLFRNELDIRCRLLARVGIGGLWPNALQMGLELETSQTVFNNPWVELAPFSARLALNGTYPLFNLTQGRIEIPRAVLSMDAGQLNLNPVLVQLPKGRVDLQKRALIVPDIHLSSSFFEELVFSVRHEDQRSEIKLLKTDLKLLDLAKMLGLLPQGWSLKTSEDLELTVFREPERPPGFSLKLEFADLQFQNAAELYLGEGLKGTFQLKGQLQGKASRLVSDCALDIVAGEVLLDRWYLNLQKKPFSMTCSLEYQMPERIFPRFDARFRLQDLLQFSTQGRLALLQESIESHFALSLPETELPPVFQTFVQEPFQTDYSVLSDLQVRGQLKGDVEIETKGDQWWVKGRCMLHLEHFLQENGLSFDTVRLELPLWYQNRQEPVQPKLRPGSFSVRGFQAPGFPEQSLQVTVLVGPNSLQTQGATPIQTIGGDVELGPLRISELLSGHPRVQTSLTIDTFDLGRALQARLDRSLHGVLSGELDPLVVQKAAIRTNGGLQLRIFEGLIKISGIEANNIFSTVPSFALQADFQGLDLASMTAKTQFGKIQGILEGSVENLVIAAGQPQAFDLLLETVKTKEVDQKISVKAVDNIARIGGGQSPFMGFAGALASIFQNFSYQKIGIRAHLENDRFQINGTIKEDGVEYLVKKSGLTGVNIVNSNPENQISFKDMLKRIERVTADEGQVHVE